MRFGQMDDMTITVNGMICSFCATVTYDLKSKESKKMALTIRMNNALQRYVQQTITKSCIFMHPIYA
jgi:tellurite resistance protein